MPKLKLWLVRHGETDSNAGKWTDKPTETRLTALGIEQAKKMAAQVIDPPDLLIVSPLIRARETAQFILNKWPKTPYVIWPIEEFTYLSPSRLKPMVKEVRKEQIQLYWQRNDPNFRDGTDAETFASFLQRVADFHNRIIKQQGFVIVVGHGQFLKAFQLTLRYGFMLNSEWMKRFRQEEITNHIKNGEIFQLYFD